jgi:coenzyme F420 hydrogenase subunit beta
MNENTTTKSNLLRILPNETNLRGKSVFTEEMFWPPDVGSDPPRALRGLAQIINNGLCHRCGSCVGICPTKVLTVDEQEYPKITNLSACTDCDLCAKVCPGDEFNYEDYFKKQFDTPANYQSTQGYTKETVLAHACDPVTRENSSSGGLVTALLIDLLENKQIDGALVITADDEKLWKGKPTIARDRESLIKSMKSKYAITATNSLFSEILSTPGKYAIVGLPCQIHGYIKAAELDNRLKERVVLTIGLYCHAAIEHEAYETIWETLGDKTQNAKRFISRVGKHPGAPHLELSDGTLYPVYFGYKNGYKPSSMEVINVLYRIYTPERCLTCFDALAEFADISVGDPWMPRPNKDISFYDGWSFAFVRTSRGQEIMRKARERKAINTQTVPEYMANLCNRSMSTEKRHRAFRFIETHRRQGKSIPSYGDPFQAFPKNKGFKFILTEISLLTHILCFIPKWRKPALKFCLGNGGYYLFWLNNKRRRVKKTLREWFGRFLRKFHGDK